MCDNHIDLFKEGEREILGVCANIATLPSMISKVVGFDNGYCFIKFQINIRNIHSSFL